MKVKVATLLKTDSFAEIFERLWSQELNDNAVQHFAWLLFIHSTSRRLKITMLGCFRKSKKSVLVFRANIQIVSIYGLNVSFEMSQKNSKISPCEAFLSCAANKMFIEVHSFPESSRVLNNCLNFLSSKTN